MRKTVGISLLALVISLFTFISCFAEVQNIFKNSDAENITSTAFSTGNSAVSLDIITDPYNSANHCYKITPTTGTSKIWTYIRQSVSLEAGKTYIAEFDIAATQDSSGTDIDAGQYRVNFRYNDGGTGKDHAVDGTYASTSDRWIHVKASVTVSDDYADSAGNYVGIYANPKTVGTGFVNLGFMVDNFILYKEEELPFTLPDVISDNMMLQADKPICVWGKSASDSTVSVKLCDKDGNTVRSGSAVPQDGSFKVSLDSYPVDSKAPFTLEISSENYTKKINNVIFGELWLFSGQSNMQLIMSSCGNDSDQSYINDMLPEKTIDDMRIFTATDNGVGSWKLVNDSNVKTFSAVGYTAMKTMYDTLGKPVGGICTAWGGKSMKSYTGPCDVYPTGNDVYKLRMYPFENVALRGFMWYQGENDYTNSAFDVALGTMVDSWRSAWNDASLPFYYVQLPQSPATIPNFSANLDESGNPTTTATFDYSKARFFQNHYYYSNLDNNVGMVVSFDTTTHIEPQKSAEDRLAQDPLHPWNKKPIGQRLGNYALSETYGISGIDYLSPRISSVRQGEDNTLVLTYINVENGLKTDDGLTPRFFEVAGADGVYHSATASITGKNTVVVSSAEVANPTMVAYCYETHFADMKAAFVGIEDNLTDSEGLPAIPEISSLPITVFFDTDGGSAYDDNGEYSAGQAITLPDASSTSKDGFVLRGWFDGTKTYPTGYAYTISATAVGTLTMKAVWVDVSLPVTGYGAEFMTDGDAEGWYGSKVNATVSGGFWLLTSTAGTSGTSPDPRISGNLGSGIDASTYTLIKIRMKNSTTAAGAAVRFRREGDPDNVGTCHNLGNYVSYKVEANSDYTEYVIDMSGVKNWYGIITKLWIDPVQTLDGDFSIDYIRVDRNAYDVFDESKFVPATKDAKSIRLSDPVGVRFAADVTFTQKESSSEYGFLASTKDILGETELTFDCGKTFVSGEAYNKTNGTDIVYSLSDDAVTFTAVLKNIPKENYKTVIVARPYLRVTSSDGIVHTIYGKEVSTSLLETAKTVLAKDDSLTEEQRKFLEDVVYEATGDTDIDVGKLYK